MPRRLEAAVEQLQRFLLGSGRVEQTCGDGACRCSVTTNEPPCELAVGY